MSLIFYYWLKMYQLINSVISEQEINICTESFLNRGSKEVEQILIDRVGQSYCARLSKKLSVDRSTVWRLFQRERLPTVYQFAIAALLSVELSESDVRF
jgi:hypothetical protein